MVIRKQRNHHAQGMNFLADPFDILFFLTQNAIGISHALLCNIQGSLERFGSGRAAAPAQFYAHVQLHPTGITVETTLIDLVPHASRGRTAPRAPDTRPSENLPGEWQGAVTSPATITSGPLRGILLSWPNASGILLAKQNGTPPREERAD